MHACAAWLQAAAARDEGERMVGEMAAATRQRAQAALQLEAVHAQATAWEQERRTRVNARRAELEALLGSVGTEITEITEISEITSTGAGVALKDDAGVAAPADADAALKSAREAVERASEALAQLREEASATLAQLQTRVRRSFTEAQAAAERVIEADAAAASSRARLDSAQQRAAALRASVSAWGWDALRLKAARALADAGEVSRQGILRDAAREAPTGVDIEADLARKGLVPLEQPFTFTVSKAGKDGLVTEEAAAEAGVHAEIAEIAEIDTSEAIVRSLQSVAQYMRASAMAARRRLDELPTRSEDQHAHGHTHAHGQPRGEGHVCGTCGQLVSADHLHAQHAALHAAAQAAEQAARASEAAASRAQAAADGARLASVLAQLGRVQSEMKAAEAARVSAEAEASARRDALKHRRAEAHSLEQESADYR